MDFMPQQPPQPYADSDRINAAFDNLGEDDYGGYTNEGLDGMNGYADMNGHADMNGYHDDNDHEYGQPELRDVAVVQDYATEFPEEEQEGWAYNAEKRHIRETVDLGDSYLFMWGDGEYGKLGHNNLDSMHVPFIVAATVKIPIRMCALGKDHTVLLAVDGYPLSCGSNTYGQLGTGDQNDSRMNLAVVQGASQIKAVASGHYHTLALTHSGKVLSWGSGSWGKLGLNSDANVKAPRVIASLQSSTVEFISCGAHHSVAITATGDVWTWGKGLRGQLGHNTVKEEYAPRICALLRKAGAERIRCGDDHTLVLLRNGHVFVMGANNCGQLGLGDTLDRGVPTPLVAFAEEHISDVAAAGNGSLVLTNAGKVFTFGNSELDPNCRLPRLVYTLPKADPIVALAKDSAFDYAISDTGNLFRWYASDTNWDGNGKAALESFHAIKGVVRIYAGQNHVAVICTSDMGCTQAMITRDKVMTFSNDVSKASLEKLPEETPQPPMIGVAEYLDDLQGEQHAETISREGDGTLYTFGKGVFGRLGHGLEYTLSEASIRNPKKVDVLGKMSVINIECGKDSTAAITDTGKLYTWGKYSTGKLGLGSGFNHVVVKPEAVSQFKNQVIVMVAVGRNHMAAMTDEHRFFTWGSNTFGQLGVPYITGSINQPAEISSMRELRIRHFAAGGWHTIICTWNGWVYTCGKGWHGQLGQGDYESLTAQSKTLPYFKRISEGFGDHLIVKVYGAKETSAALSETGRVFTWGLGDAFQLGHDRADNEAEPRELEALAKVRIIDLALGDSHMLALNELGNPYSWGKGTHGQLGHGELSDKEKTPRMIAICRRTQTIGFREIERDIPWGSFYIMKDKQPGETEETEIEYTQAGRVCLIAADGNYSLFVLKRLANKDEVRRYNDAVERNDYTMKKMTEMTVLHELFGCGCGKGGVLQSVGKENEFLPKLLPKMDGGELMQDVVAVSAGKAHVGIIAREDPLRNVEFGNLKDMEKEDAKSNKARQIAKQETQLEEMEEEEELVAEEEVDPFALAAQNELEEFLVNIDQDKWLQTLIDNDVDLETLSTLRTDDELKELGVDVLGARRRLLKEILNEDNGLQIKYSPAFYSYTNDLWFYLSWPPNSTEDAMQRGKKGGGSGANPFSLWLKKKAAAKIFRSLVRYAEIKHFEAIRDRSNKRYEADPEGVYRVFSWGAGTLGRLGHGYGISYATPTEILTFPLQAKVIEVACGCEHTLARTFDGAVLAWGNGDRGQLGTTENYHGVGVNNLIIPHAIPQLKRFFIVSIAAGRWHNMALTSDRQVWIWGSGHFGQLGLDNFESVGIPQLIRALDGRAVCKLLCGGWHSAVITETGKMLIWGKNTHGQLGFGDTKSTNFPKINQDLRYHGKIRTAALGANHTLVVMVMNKVFAFGDNNYGQLGLDDKRQNQREPREVMDLKSKNICQVSAGDQHSVTLSVFGEVWAWGGSPYGQLGHGGITDLSRPTPLLERHNIPPDVKSIQCGYTFTSALSKKGDLYTWGQGESGELGHPPKVLLYAPAQVQDFSNVHMVSCGHRHMTVVQFNPRISQMDAVGLKTDDATATLGGTSRHSGSGTTSPRSGAASSRRHSNNLAALQATKRHGVALLWGEDTCGQLGMRGLQAARSPTIMQLLMGHNIVDVAASSDMSAFVTDSGSVFVCGSGDEGRLGLGHLGPAPTPTEVRGLGNTKVTKVACGFGHTIVMSEDRRVFVWGEGTWGNTGISNSSEVLEPQELHSLAALDVHDIFAGGFHSAAVTAMGHLYTWGKNTNGQLGLGTVTSGEESPQRVTGVTGIVKDVALGQNHTAILMQVSPPNVFTCGLNGNGQLGHEDFVDRCDMMPVNYLDDRMLVSVACGSAHTVVVSQYGDMIAWGNGRNGQLGLFSGVDSDHNTPQQLPAFCDDQVVKVVCGQELTCAVTDKGNVYMCGRESQVGLGGSAPKSTANPTVPREIEGLRHPTRLALGTVHAIALYSSNLDADE